ncbi:6-phosphogluconolactonase [Bacteroidota bacterium]
MQNKVKIFKNPGELAKDAALNFKSLTKVKKSGNFNVLLSGGNTPVLLFEYIREHLLKEFKWEHIHFFWGDERCVPSDHPDSNYGNANTILLKYLDIPTSSIHPIIGETHPYLEADRYSKIIHDHFEEKENVPVFDLVFLGLGADGHVASLFPGQDMIFHSNRLFEVTIHPETGQNRITATSKLINQATNIYFLVAGEKKAFVLNRIINKVKGFEKYPASGIIPVNGKLTWFVDKAAATYL